MIEEEFLQAKFSLNLNTEKFQREASLVIKDNGEGKKHIWIRFIEGVTGHMGENDFEYTAEIDGVGYKFKVPEGQLNFDISYRTDSNTVSVMINALEKDLLFDDKYSPENALVLATKAPGNVGIIKLKRKTIFGEMFTSRDHQVTVVVSEDEQTLNERSAAIIGGSLQARNNEQKSASVNTSTQQKTGSKNLSSAEKETQSAESAQ